jgi:hypothetical protein
MTVAMKSRGDRVNSSHPRKLEDKTRSLCEVENLYKQAFNMKC